MIKKKRKILSISLGSSSRDHEVRLPLRGEEWTVGRKGFDGDLALCRAAYLEHEDQVDAFGMGGIDRWLWVGERRYEFRDARNLVQGMRVPVADGSGLKHHLESALVRRLLEEGKVMKKGDKVVVVSGLDRWGMAKAFHEGNCDVLYGDLIFGLGLPIPIRSLESLGRVGRGILPVVTQLPFKWLYPTGEKQEELGGKESKWLEGCRVIAGDFHYIRRNLPKSLEGKVVLTNTTTKEDVELLTSLGLEWLVTTTPRFEGRSVGTHVVEALFFGLEGRDKRGSDAYDRLAGEVDFS
ncbi:quinate 5-dehydrogenase [bacterium]|nr:quinate 5-dehydrogenase [bacterium]